MFHLATGGRAGAGHPGTNSSIPCRVWDILRHYMADASEYAPPPAAHQIRQDGARRVWCASGTRRIGTCQAAHPANITKAKVLMLASLPLIPRLLLPAQLCVKAGRCPSTAAQLPLNCRTTAVVFYGIFAIWEESPFPLRRIAPLPRRFSRKSHKIQRQLCGS